MKYLVLFLFFHLINFNLFSQDIIKYTGFEGDSLEWKGKLLGGDNISDTLSALRGDTAHGVADFPANQRILSGNRSWQINNTSETLILDSVTMEAYDSVLLKLRFSGTSTMNNQGLDHDDQIQVFVAVNGNSFSSSPQIIITGGPGPEQNNSQWGFTADSIVNTLYDTTTIYDIPNGGMDNRTASSTAVINFYKPGVTSIKVKIIAFTNEDNEFWNIDNLLLQGLKKTPLNLSNISLSLKDQKTSVFLSWSKLDEINCINYTVQRSHDLVEFEDLSSVNCSYIEGERHTYSYTDLKPKTGWNYYVIRLENANRFFEFSDIRSIYRNFSAQFKIYPTLAQDILKVFAPKQQDFNYVIYDTNGRSVQSKDRLKENYVVPVDRLVPGVYFIYISSGLFFDTFKFVKV